MKKNFALAVLTVTIAGFYRMYVLRVALVCELPAATIAGLDKYFCISMDKTTIGLPNFKLQQ